MRDKFYVILIGIFFITIPFASYSAANRSETIESSRLVVSMGGKCVISIKDYFKGRLASGMPMHASYWAEKMPVETQMSKFSINFTCISLINESKEDVARQHGVVRDGNGGRWVPYFDNEREARLLREFTTVNNLDAVNGNGFYLIQDDRDGDPAQRERYLAFCIFYKTIAVCGGQPVMYLSDPKGNLLPYVLDILRSVEFVDNLEHKATLENPSVVP
jgi:hypothetical protein